MRKYLYSHFKTVSCLLAFISVLGIPALAQQSIDDNKLSVVNCLMLIDRAQQNDNDGIETVGEDAHKVNLICDKAAHESETPEFKIRMYDYAIQGKYHENKSHPEACKYTEDSGAIDYAMEVLTHPGEYTQYAERLAQFLQDNYIKGCRKTA